MSFTIATVASTDFARAAAPSSDDDQLQEVVVTGTLIPQAKSQIFTPVTVITAEDIQAKGFTTVADALQHGSFATGSVQGGSTPNNFTAGADTISLFGLDPSYTKFLIDGRPMADYPALYNGSENFVSISGIPTLLVESIEILPGGQSSIYGSDAIAGVVNITLKKKMDGPVVDARYGWTTDGGGVDRRFGVADGFQLGGFNILVGGQYENTSPIWSYKRSLTADYFAHGTTPQTAERDWLALGLFGQANGDLYYFLDPANCANVASQFGGTVGMQSRAGRGEYCGTYRASAQTVGKGTEGTQGYLHISNDITEHTQVFVDVLVDHDVARTSTGGGFFSTADDSAGPYYYYLDPNLGDYMNLQQIYSPEEIGGLNNTMDRNTTNSLRALVGITGDIGGSAYKYDFDFMYTENRLSEARHIQFEDEINNFYASIFGPNLGVDPNFGVNTYTPNYAQFYQPITPAQYASFSGYATSRSRTEESLLRAQLTNAKLFHLPGGDAGLALVAETGLQGWNYDPDPAFLDGQAYLNSATAGSGHRVRYAVTSELRLPVVPQLTADLSGRYDAYRVEGNTVDAATYNAGLEFRPLSNDIVMFRGRYGTAFKAPTLADEFQGQSGSFYTLTDYYACEQRGYPAPTFTNAAGVTCPYANTSLQAQTAGNPKLSATTAKVWDLGVVLSPIEHSALTVDFMRWKISNEVTSLSPDTTLALESECLQGQRDPTSPTCTDAVSSVTRDANGLVTLINVSKVNLATEYLSVIQVGLNYVFPTTQMGTFALQGNYTDLLKHSEILFAGDAEDNLLQDPVLSTEFKTRENLSLTWNFQKFTSTVYVERYGRTPNDASTVPGEGGYTAVGAGRVGTWTLVNLSAQYEVLPGLALMFNCDNVANKMPPTDNSYTGIEATPYNQNNYNVYGRSFFVQAQYKYKK